MTWYCGMTWYLSCHVIWYHIYKIHLAANCISYLRESNIAETKCRRIKYRRKQHMIFSLNHFSPFTRATHSQMAVIHDKAWKPFSGLHSIWILILYFLLNSKTLVSMDKLRLVATSISYLKMKSQKTAYDFPPWPLFSTFTRATQ